MPIYEYECLNCQEQFEKLVYRINDLITCPRCGQSDVNKKLSLFSSPGSKSAGSGSSCGSCSSKNCSSCG
ncbi:MAG: zinc ribbon domain-containing protein [Candidatus Schekmanbacteria bacterium]|nr:zinc ribbon domain-containing protein [Candidatus Schekmanbacteria bacterium]